MRNVEWVSLSDAERGQLVSIWLLAADQNGTIPSSPEIIQKLCYMETLPNINKFIDLGFLVTEWLPNGNRVVTKCPPREEKSRVENKKSHRKAESYALPDKEILKEAALPKIITDLNELCEKLYNEDIFKKAHAFKNTMLKNGTNERALYHAFTRCYIKRKFKNDKDAWGYCTNILKVEDGNYNESDFRKDQK